MQIFTGAAHGLAAGATPGRPETAKHALLGIAGVRTIAALVALPLLPVLYQHDFLVLVALRPSLGILLLGAILARQGGMSLWAMLLIAVPLQLLIVWLYFLLGRAWQSEIHSDDRLPFLTARLLRRDQVRRIREALQAHGSRLVVLSRFAIFPTGLLAAAAGASGMKPVRYFPADGLAFAAAAGLVVGAGYGLGLAQRQSDLWLTIIGAAGLIVLSGLLTSYVRRAPKQRSQPASLVALIVPVALAGPVALAVPVPVPVSAGRFGHRAGWDATGRFLLCHRAESGADGGLAGGPRDRAAMRPGGGAGRTAVTGRRGRG